MKLILAKLWRRLGLSKMVQLLIMRVMQDQFLIGTTGVIFDSSNRILLLKHTYRQIQWSLPGGYIKGAEHPIEGLEREIKEECGYTVSIDSQLKLRTDRETARLDICYVGTFIGGTFKASEEVTEAQFYPFERLPHIAKSQLFMIHEALEMRKKKETKTDLSISESKKENILHFFKKVFKKKTYILQLH